MSLGWSKSRNINITADQLIKNCFTKYPKAGHMAIKMRFAHPGDFKYRSIVQKQNIEMRMAKASRWRQWEKALIRGEVAVRKKTKKERIVQVLGKGIK